MRNKTFIEESVGFLYSKFGADISDVTIIIPSRRSSLFFNQALARLIGDRPIWQPKYIALPDLFSELGGAKPAERLKLIALLYSVYSKYHKETFDQFYYWGDMLLNDFEAIDNYMVDSRVLFDNSGDIRDIESSFDFMEDGDREEIARFWRNFSKSKNSEEKEFFFNIWRTLYPIYTEFKELLRGQNIGYTGMICRDVAEKIIAGEISIPADKNYAVIGFNALSNTEKALLDALKKGENVTFLWDSDDYYSLKSDSEAGIFLRPNILRYGEDNKIVRSNFLKEKDITVIKSPSKSLESKYVWEFLSQCQAKAQSEGRELGPETAIVLTDESLLMPILYSIPPEIKHFNVTAGYELRVTQIYTLIESIIALQTNADEEFYYKDVDKILSNSLIIKTIDAEEYKALRGGLSKDIIYYKRSVFEGETFASVLFTKHRGWSNICSYLLKIINRISITSMRENNIIRESLFRSYSAIESISELIGSLGIDVNDKILYSLIRKHLRKERISFEGEPLIGIQIMGILESRTLDFENVLILSVEEDNFPSKSIGASFIPANLRSGYGLPTSKHHQAIYSYYFYRLIQRANRVDVSYVSVGDETSTGEPTRYIHQLIYANNHEIKDLTLSIDLSLSDSDEIRISKEGSVGDFVNEIKEGDRRLSASAFHNYVECPLRYYYDKVEKISEDEEREMEVDGLAIGNFIHHIMEELYKPFIGIENSDLKDKLKIISDIEINAIMEKFIVEWAGDMYETLKTDLYFARQTILKHIRHIIDYDLRRTDGFRILELESEVIGDIGGYMFYGLIDRVDVLPNGLRMIIDYKSGANKVVDNISELVDTQNDLNSKPHLQALIYSSVYSKKNNVDVVPALYYSADMGSEEYTPLLKVKSLSFIEKYSDVKEEFELVIDGKLEELTNTEIPFYQCNKGKKCDYCRFVQICEL